MFQNQFSPQYLLIFSLVSFISRSVTVPVPSGSDLKSLDDKAFKFMQSFGYLELATAPDNSNGSITPAGLTHYRDGLQRIVREIQHYGGLGETGDLDESTLELMKSERCGCPDVLPKSQRVRAKRYVLSAGSWNRNNLTYHLDLWNTKFNRKAIRRELDKAFKIWSEYGHIQFEELRDKRADIVISFQSGIHEDGNAFDGPGGVLAHAFFPGESPYLARETPSLAGDIHFDADENWSFDRKVDHEGPDFFSTAVHELGHSLGLAHSPERDSIMNPYYKFQKSGHLASDDILGIYDRYISRGQRPPDATTQRTSPTYQTTSRQEEPRSPSTQPSWNRFHHECSREHPYHCHHHHRDANHHHRRTTIQYDSASDVTSNPKRTTSRNDASSGDVTTKSTEEVEPDICEEGAVIDAISAYRGELLVFRKQWLWRLRDLGESVQPVIVQRLFTQLPVDLKKIDAAFHNEVSSTLVLFSGPKFWEFFGSTLKLSGRLSDLGLPPHVEKIDAASEWSMGERKDILLFSGDNFWVLNESSRVISPEDLPASTLSQLKAIPKPLAAAFIWKPDVLSLVQQGHFWTLAEDEKYPKMSEETFGQFVFNCNSKIRS